MPPKSLQAIAAAAALLVVTGCSTHADPAPAAVTAAVTPSKAPSQPSYSTVPVIAKPVIGNLHGAPRSLAEAGYRALVTYVREDSYVPQRMKPKVAYTAADFSGPLEHMTSGLAKEIRKNIAAATTKRDRKDSGTVNVIALFNLTPKISSEAFLFAPSGPLVVDERITSPKITSSDAGLKIKLTYSADLRLLKNGDANQPFLSSVTKTVTYTLLLERGSWRIDNFTGEYTLHDWLQAGYDSSN